LVDFPDETAGFIENDYMTDDISQYLPVIFFISHFLRVIFFIEILCNTKADPEKKVVLALIFTNYGTDFFPTGGNLLKKSDDDRCHRNHLQPRL
jgi:hypothetical protein